MVDTEWIIFIIGASIAFGLMLPLMIYWFYRTYKYRHHSFISARHPKILFLNCTLSCLCVIERIVSLARDLSLFNQILNYDLLTRNILYVAIFGLYIHSYLLRQWLLFYDLGYREAQVNIRWEHDLNVFRSHWFVEHRSNLGNVKFMMIFVMVLYLFGFAGLILLQYLHSPIAWGIGISAYGALLASIFIIISSKISIISKSLIMKREMMYVGIVLLLTAVTYSLIINFAEINYLIKICVSWTISINVPFLLHQMSTWYQIKSNTKNKKSLSANNKKCNYSLNDYQNKKLH